MIKMTFKCWLCRREISFKFKNAGIGICWKCGKKFGPYATKSRSSRDPSIWKYCSKECRYPKFCNDKCEASFKKLLKKWHGMLDYTYVRKNGIEKIKIRTYKYIILTILGILSIFIFLFVSFLG